MGPLYRHGFSESCLYVAYSHVRHLEDLVLSTPLTMEYLRKFTPPMAVLMEMKGLLERVDVPPYGTEADKSIIRVLAPIPVLKHIHYRYHRYYHYH